MSFIGAAAIIGGSGLLATGGGAAISGSEGAKNAKKVPKAPSITDVMNQYEQALPGLEKTNSDLMNQYMPGALGLTGQLAGIASKGMDSNTPDWMRQQYQSDMSGALGTNAGSPIGADYRSRGLLQQSEDWKRYYQGLGLNVANSASSTYGALTGGFTPGQALQYSQGNYSSYLPQYQAASQYTPGASALTGLGGQMMGIGMGGIVQGVNNQSMINSLNKAGAFNSNYGLTNPFQSGNTFGH